MIEITLPYEADPYEPNPFKGLSPAEITPEYLDNGWRPVSATFRKDGGCRFVDLKFATGEDAWEWMNAEGFELDEIESRVR